MKGLRIAVRALIVEDDRLLLVNAWPGGKSDLWCAPGGGVETHSSLPDNLIREVHEETGLTVSVGDPVLVNEYHDRGDDFHQVEIFFRASITAGSLDASWTDPEGIVTERRFFAREDLTGLRYRPAALDGLAWGTGIAYDPLEPLWR